MSEINAQFYSTKKLNSRQFKVSGDPYEFVPNNPNSMVAKELKDLGIFIYRDEYHPDPLVLLPLPELPLNGYYFQVILDEDDFSVAEFEEPDPEMVKKVGDALAWIKYNWPCYVISVDQNGIQVQR